MPILGGVFIWLLLKIMFFGGVALSWFLVPAQSATGISAAASYFLEAVCTEREHHVAGKLINFKNRLVDRAITSIRGRVTFHH
jgi:hypothetical protein